MKKKYQQFEDLIVWQEGVNLCCDVYKELIECKEYSLKNQITKSAISIPSNVAEGFERQSDKEFVKFLYYAKGSSGELRTQLFIANRLCLIDEVFCTEAIARSRRISGMLQNLITTIKHDINNNPKRPLSLFSFFSLLGFSAFKRFSLFRLKPL